MAKQIVGNMSDWSGMLKDFFRQINDGSITMEQLRDFLEHRNPFEQKYIKIEDYSWKKTSEIIAELRELFPVIIYNEDEINIDREFPTPAKSTFRTFLFNQEADYALRNKSADELKHNKIEGITLRERLIYELEYFNKTGQHLDIRYSTLCSGSRSSSRKFPRVLWINGLRIDIDYIFSGTSSEKMCSRRAY